MSLEPRQMDFLAVLDAPRAQPRPTLRQRRGRIAQQSGLAAEQAAERHYGARGARILSRRWRGPRAHGGCDIDLIVKQDGVTVFIEVKARRSFAEAGESMTPRQWTRLERAAESYMLSTGMGTNAAVRFDVVLIDRSGGMQIIENAQPY